MPSLPQHLIASHSAFTGHLKSPSHSMKPLFTIQSPTDLASHGSYKLY